MHLGLATQADGSLGFGAKGHKGTGAWKGPSLQAFVQVAMFLLGYFSRLFLSHHLPPLLTSPGKDCCWDDVTLSLVREGSGLAGASVY